VERFALRLKTDPSLDPYYSQHYINEQDRLAGMSEEAADQEAEAWNVEEIEREKEEEEYRALSEGELLATNLTRQEITRFKTWFVQERAKQGRARRRRILTGESWELTRDSRIENGWYWYNYDTCEKRSTKPKILIENDVLLAAFQYGYNAVPSRILLHIFSFLLPWPDRLRASEVCQSWLEAARDQSFFKRVLSVETGARDAPTGEGAPDAIKLSWNTFASVTDALQAALPGDTIQLTTGHHWESTLEINVPLRFLGEASDPSRCVLELTGSLSVRRAAGRVDLSGITVRRPRKLPQAAAVVSVSGATLSVR
jgi:hypothetical protein